jgi:hypothetical protein
MARTWITYSAFSLLFIACSPAGSGSSDSDSKSGDGDGEGKDGSQAALKLVEAKAFSSGVVLMVYQPDRKEEI